MISRKNLFFSFPKYCIIKCMFRKINVFETKYKAFSFIQFWWGSPYTIYKTIHDFEVCPRNTIYYNSGGYPHKNKYSTNIYTRKIDLVGSIGSNKVVVDDIKFEKELGRWSILGDFLSFGAICETGRGGKTNADNCISLKFFLSKLSITKPYGNLWLVVVILLCPHLQFIKQCLILRFEVTYTSAQAQIMWSTILYWYLFCCIGQNSLTLTNFETCISRAFDAIASSSGGIQTKNDQDHSSWQYYKK